MTEKLFEGKSFTFRNGVNDFYWKGMATKQDPEAQSPDRPRLVVNGRYIGGHIVSRPATAASAAQIPQQTGLDFTASDWELAFLGEHHSYGGVKLWWGAQFAPGTYLGGTFGYVDTDGDPEHNELAVHYQTTSAAPVLVYYGGFVYAGATGALRRLYRIDQAPGVVETVPVKLPADEVVVSCPGFIISALHVHDGVLYYVMGAISSGTGYIYSWDGYQNVLEYTFTGAGMAANVGASITTFQEKVVVAAKGVGAIIVRSAAGTWSAIAITGCSGYTNSMAQLKDKLYIAGGADVLYSFDGTTVATARTLNTGTGEEGLNCVCAFNGRLYYTWKENLGSDKYWPWLGVFEPEAVDASFKWKDDYKTLGTGVLTVTVTDVHSTDGEHPYVMPGTVTALAVYRQRLYAAVTLNTADTRPDSKIMTHDVANNPYSDWYVTHAYEDTAAIPAGPTYFEKQLAATGNYNERVIQYLKVI